MTIFFDENRGDKKMELTFCFSFSLISFRVCADPINSKSFFIEYALCKISLLNAGMYAPFKLCFIASLILLLK